MGIQSHLIVGGLCGVIGLGAGYHYRSLQVDAAGRREAEHVVTRTAKAAEITQTVAAKVEAQQERVRVVTRTIIQKVNVYVPAEVDHRYLVPVGAVRLLNYAAAGVASPAVPDGAGEPIDAPSDVAMSALVETVSENYGACHAWREALIGWQDWYATQKKAWDAK